MKGNFYATCVGALVGYVVYRVLTRNKNPKFYNVPDDDIVEPSEPTIVRPQRPVTTSVYRPQRRRRKAGGFYPVGYNGPYERGEDLVDFLVWMAIIDMMTDDERSVLGEYADTEGFDIADYSDEIQITDVSAYDDDDDLSYDDIVKADEPAYESEPAYEPEPEPIRSTPTYEPSYDSGSSSSSSSSSYDSGSSSSSYDSGSSSSDSGGSDY